MNIAKTFSYAWKRLKEKVSAIFEPNEIEKIAHETKFIQRSTSLLQGKDFVDLMSAASIDPKIDIELDFGLISLPSVAKSVQI